MCNTNGRFYRIIHAVVAHNQYGRLVDKVLIIIRCINSQRLQANTSTDGSRRKPAHAQCVVPQSLHPSQSPNHVVAGVAQPEQQAHDPPEA